MSFLTHNEGPTEAHAPWKSSQASHLSLSDQVGFEFNLSTSTFYHQLKFCSTWLAQFDDYWSMRILCDHYNYIFQFCRHQMAIVVKIWIENHDLFTAELAQKSVFNIWPWTLLMQGTLFLFILHIYLVGFPLKFWRYQDKQSQHWKLKLIDIVEEPRKSSINYWKWGPALHVTSLERVFFQWCGVATITPFCSNSSHNIIVHTLLQPKVRMPHATYV